MLYAYRDILLFSTKKAKKLKARKKKKHLTSYLFNPRYWKKYTLFVIRLSTILLRDIKESNLKIHAAGLAYVTIVTIAPLLAISFSVLKGFGVHSQMEPFLLNFLSPLGEQGHDIAERIIIFVDNIKVGVLGSVGLAMLIFAVMSMMCKIETAFNNIWRVRQERSIVQRMRDYFSVLFIGPLFMSLSVAMTEMLSNKSFLIDKFGTDFSNRFLHPVTELIPYALFVFAFTALYMFMPNTQVKFVPAAIAGLLAAVMWKFMGQLFGIFVVGAGSYAAIYSAFAALMLLMIWIYLGWLIVLIGAAMAYYIQNPSSQKISRKYRAMSGRVREKAALLICSEIGRSFYACEAPLTLYKLVRQVGLPFVIISDIAETLARAGILSITGKASHSCYIPGCPFDEITVDEMFKKLHTVEENGGICYHNMKQSKAVDEILMSAETLVQQELAKKTLKNLAVG